MKKQTARYLADALTWARIVSLLPITLLAWAGLRWWVFGLYVAASLTDLFDGMLARRGSPPASDVDLDGIADLVFSFATLLWLWLLAPEIVARYWLPYVPVLVLLEVHLSIVRFRHKRFGIPHLQFGRFAMALFFFLLPVIIVWGDVPWFVHAVLSIGVASKLQLVWAVWQKTRLKPSQDRSGR